ncbi:hypothetical protein AAGW18_22485 [Vreelandella titanicae]|jgi:hypothetical protein|uniref:integrase domain-containing protein n=1 Tax=Vreelandella titanicae TaxID=664683 RepID=UPI0031581A42|nr:hypothetical protein LMS44_18180 [Halomonas profundus]|tara:strand:- start:1065 stop:2069 length:1005 start_codon:yes stop_codon:yes gene_type:complete
MKKQKRFNRNWTKRNFGLGHKPGYAAKVALAQAYGGSDHYYTRFTHHSRFEHYLDWLSELDPPIRDLRKITLAHAIEYSEALANSVASGDMKVSYAQNLVSTLNTVMRAVRQDQAIWLSPADVVGKRSYIRTSLPLATWDKVIEAVQLAEAKGNFRGASLVLLWRAFGMRFREAALADLPRLKAEADTYNAVWILDGTKGGFKSEKRRIQIESVQWQSLDYALHTISDSGSCLIDGNNSLKEFLNRHANPMRPILKQVGIQCPKDLRAENFIEVYERTSGQLAPLKQSGAFDREADSVGREVVGHQGGHKRPTVASSYVGKRDRTNRDVEVAKP